MFEDHNSSPESRNGFHSPPAPVTTAGEILEDRFPQLEDRERLFARLIDAVQPGICLVDRSGIIVHANRASSDIFGYGVEELVGQSFLRIYEPERQAHMLHLHEEVIRGNVVHPFETVLRRKDGREVWAQISSNLLQFEGDRYRVVSVLDVTERKRLEQSLQALATTDSLTGVANRRQFLELARHEVLRGRRKENLPAVIMIDLDNFKKINDTYGHATGDRALMEFSLCAVHTLRACDIFGRLGGEEFAAILPDTDEASAATIAGRLRHAIASLSVPAPGGDIDFTASFGVARVADGETTVEAALHRADLALYRAKQLGRNRVECAEAIAETVQG
jgi:diguanylate cyclase (GGDEF)-like protein/PAS domain S-box-containing protein